MTKFCAIIFNSRLQRYRFFKLS